MSKILYEVYQNDIKDSESVMYGKWYARLKSIETMSTEKLAKHISEHGSVFTADVVEGVMKKVKNCLIEMLLESKKVKIAGLGTFYLTCECQKGGADKESDFNVAQHLKALHIRFLPDQTEEDNLSSREFIKKAEFVNIKSLLSGKDEEEDAETTENDNNGSTENGGSQNGSQSGNGGSQNQSGNGGSQSGNEGSQSGNEGGNSQNQGSTYALTITKSGTGTASVKNDSEETINSGDSLAAGANVYVAVTPAQGQIPTATLNGESVSLSENDGEYIGTFQMPAQASSLVINSGSVSGGSADQN